MSFQANQRSKLITRRHVSFDFIGNRSIVETSQNITNTVITDSAFTAGESHAAFLVVSLQSDGLTYKASPLQTDNKIGMYWAVEEGVITESCVYRNKGVLTGFTGLTTGDYLYLDVSGTYTQEPPKDQTTTKNTTQIIGRAITSDTIEIIFKEMLKLC